jgi:ATP-binding cassette subfamily C protein CydCD
VAALAATTAVVDGALEQRTDGVGAAPLPHAVDGLELDGVGARWPGAAQLAFVDVNAAVSRGEWLLVTGPSGSGKSTLLTLLLGYLRPEHGSYSLDGRDSASVDAADIRNHIAWAPQEGHLFDSTIRANLLLARSRGDAPTDDELDEVVRRVALGSLLDSLPQGLDTRVGSQGASLSGGQRQRLAVARTLLTRADIVLLDEPTAHLDEDSASRMMADLRLATSDQATVLVTHRMDDVERSDAVVTLDRSAEVRTCRAEAAGIPFGLSS